MTNRQLKNEVLHLSLLKWNWNSYGSRPISLGCIVNGLYLIDQIIGKHPKYRWVVIPTSSGGISFEFCELSSSCELDISSKGEINGYIEYFTAGGKEVSYGEWTDTIIGLETTKNYLRSIKIICTN